MPTTLACGLQGLKSSYPLDPSSGGSIPSAAAARVVPIGAEPGGLSMFGASTAADISKSSDLLTPQSVPNPSILPNAAQRFLIFGTTNPTALRGPPEVVPPLGARPESHGAFGWLNTHPTDVPS